MVLGLDLRGGVYLEYQADFSDTPDAQRGEKLEETKRIIESRVNRFGVTEPIIYTMGEDRIVVQLPGFADLERAKQLVGKTAELIFREEAASVSTVLAAAAAAGDTELTVDSVAGLAEGDFFAVGSGQTAEAKAIVAIDLEGNALTLDSGLFFDHEADEPVIDLWTLATGTIDGQERALTGAYLKPESYVDVDPTSGAPVVAFEWDEEGAELFSQVTGRLIGEPLAIFLDEELISAPTVESQISDRGIITGLSLEQAQTLAIQLNTGALPITLHEVRMQKVDPTLGADSLQKSLVAGIVGLALVLIFMMVYYRLPGAVASLALIIYALLVLMLFKLIPVTLTLAGIAALVLSIGMAVDANILIFERMREELRAGKSLGAAVEAGFSRAWPAIRDSNISTFITCAILYWFGSRFGAAPVMGFALTLFVGVAVSMFTAMVVTRTFMRLIVPTSFAKRSALFRA